MFIIFNFSPYNLTAAVFAEIDTEKYSQVVVLVKDGSKYETFESLQGAKACFPEFGGIGKSFQVLKCVTVITI